MQKKKLTTTEDAWVGTSILSCHHLKTRNIGASPLERRVSLDEESMDGDVTGVTTDSDDEDGKLSLDT